MEIATFMVVKKKGEMVGEVAGTTISGWDAILSDMTRAGWDLITVLPVTYKTKRGTTRCTGYQVFIRRL